MAQSVIGALRVNLGLDSAQFERGAKRAQGSLGQMRAQFLKVSAAAAALGAAVTAMAMRGANNIDNLAKSARRLDASVTAFRALQLAADEAGVPVQTLADNIQTMQREIAAGSTGAVRAMNRLGLSIKDMAGMDADERLALIADRIKEMGLTAAEASVLLRDLGIRNREMVLLLMGGGDAIRGARKDIEQYGLALSNVDAKRIEEANDQIGRLSIVSEYLSNQLALALVPAFGALAQSITESMREGGLLRRVIDGLVDSIGRITAYATAAVAVFGIRYVAAFAAAKVATMTLAGALVMLRRALILTGIGALVVLIGEVVYRFGQLAKAAGSTSEAFNLLGDVFREVFERMQMRVQAFSLDFKSFSEYLKSIWFDLMAKLGSAWASFIGYIAPSINAIADFLGTGLRIDIQGAEEAAASLEKSADAARENAVWNRALAQEMRRLAGSPLDSLKAIRDVMAESGENTEQFSAAIQDLEFNIESAGGAAGNLDKELQGLDKTGDGLARTMSGTFANIVTGSQNAKDAIGQLLNTLANMLAQKAFMSMFGGSTALSSIGSFFGFANGTPNAPGGLALVGERGPELVNLPRGSKVYDSQSSQRMMGSGDSVVINQTINVSTGVAQTVRTEIASLLPQISEAAKIAVLDARKRGGSFAAAFGG